MDINKVILTGRLGSDAIHTPGDSERVEFSIAVTDTWQGKNGDRKERTSWVSCVKWRGSAKLAALLTKGRKIAVTGSIDVAKYDKDGETRYSTKINVHDFNFLWPKAGESKATDEGDLPF